MSRPHLRSTLYHNGSQRLAVSFGGAEDAPGVVFLHGGGQTRHAWSASAGRIQSAGYRVVSMDLRGHGDSDWAIDADYRIETQVGDLLAVLRRLPRPPVLVGASLGGLIALNTLARHPYCAVALVLVDVAPKVDRQGAERIRAFMQANPQGFASYAEAAEVIARYLPHRPKPKDLSGLQRNLRLRDGRYYWHWDPRLFSSLDSTPQTLPSRHELAAAAITQPTLLIRGSRSELVGEEHVRHFLKLMPHARYINVLDAGHMVAGDSNETFTHALLGFLTEVHPPA
ncbi:alpha/beta hydrolase [Pseudomonas sp. NBRC 100443]|uniref:alpha/beta fold hydrolase n=1 Tax=Pseudomonas sp. NBRC 100443 TaxID=1113665 RepID=UPI0024A4EEB9|nr:alpha/beta hydrolase [Pseudomonas sp. NBRC 100443]GLU37314.1 peroxidase [Pseudomonas sp. NBRC 100443]